MAGFLPKGDDFDVNDCSLLNEPINIKDILSSGSYFTISNSLDAKNIRNSEIFDDFGAGSDSDDDVDEDSDDFHKIIMSPWEHKFEDLQKEMIKISDGIYKKLVKKGLEKFGLVPRANARVVISYNSYKELDVKPIDSTYLRGYNQTLYTGKESMVVGLETALCSMYKGEKAQFLISYKYLFGEHGCPPRIPRKSDLLYTIEVIDFVDIGDLSAIDDIPEEDRHKFFIVFPKVKEACKQGKDFFALKNYEYAIKTFFRAVHILDCCQLANESEELEQKDYLKKLYTNLAVCFHKRDSPKKVLSMLNSLRRVDRFAYYRNVKALYFEGQALAKLCEYNRARIILNKAQRIEPSNPEINEALNNLAAKSNKHKMAEKEMCERALGILNDTKPKSPIKNYSQFDKEIIQTLESFKLDNDLNEMNFPPNLTNFECEAIAQLVENVNLKLVIAADGTKIITKD